MKKLIISIAVIFIFVTSIKGQWVWQNPYPVGNKINSINFTTNNNCFFSDDAGYIYKSTNGGLNWSILNENEIGKYCYFINNNTGIANTSQIKRTTNAGVSWYNVTSGTGTSISFKDNNTGIISGNAGKTFRTTNGGLNFSQANINTNPNLNTAFLFNDFGIAAGIDVFCSGNGGSNWSYKPANLFNTYGSFILNDSNGWIVGKDGKIFKTTNYGNNWIEKYSNITNSLRDVFFINQNTGIIVGDSGRILKTNNGGNTWYPVNSNIIIPLYDIAFSTQNEFCVVGHAGKIIKSTDLGENWNELSYGSYYTINDLDFINSNTGIAVSDKGFILKTINGGNTWDIINNQVNNDLNRIEFINSNTITGVGDGIVLRSTNSGINWVTQSIIPSNVDFSGISFINENTGIISGKSPSSNDIFKTNDGGASWINLQENNTFEDVILLNENLGFGVGGNKVLKTTNGGLNWNTKNINTTSELMSIDFINDSLGMGCADDGTIILTTNSGNHWLLVNSGFTDLRKIKFVNNNFAISVGNTGKVIKSFDGGITWSINKTKTIDNLYSLYAFDSSNIYVCGRNGTILHTSNGGSVFVNSINNKIPNKFVLYQNYPNPFNPTTNIKFDLHNNSNVKLIIYDIIGKEIITLVNQKLSAGTYEINWDGSSYPSGVYFYRIAIHSDKLETEEFTNTKKMVLLK